MRRPWPERPIIVRALAAADLGVDPDAAGAAGVVGLAACAVAAVLAGPASAAGLAVVWFGVPGMVLVTWRGRREARMVAALPALLDGLAADLRSGGTVFGGLAAAARRPGPLASDVAAVVDRAGGESSLGASIAAWRDASTVPAVGVVAGALEVAVAVGGRSAAALEGLAAGLADRQAVRDEAVALSAQARLSAIVVGVAPLAALGLSALADGRVPAALLGTSAGRACLVGGLGLQAAAVLWMRRILRVVDA